MVSIFFFFKDVLFGGIYTWWFCPYFGVFLQFIWSNGIIYPVEQCFSNYDEGTVLDFQSILNWYRSYCTYYRTTKQTEHMQLIRSIKNTWTSSYAIQQKKPINNVLKYVGLNISKH